MTPARARLTAATALLLGAAMMPATADAQTPAPPAVTDTDRLNAREQFTAGMKAQQEGHWAEALLAFQRAQALFPAPTNMLHIAECEAQMGRLVEAAETYRGLKLLQLPKDAPQPFFAAQAQGAAELQQVEARIPKMRIDVTPAGIPNLSVTLDQQPINVVLLGADRSVDPGVHTVVAFAPGYGQKEAKVTVREREPSVKVVTLALQPTGGVVYVPSGPGTQVIPPPQPEVVVVNAPPPPPPGPPPPPPVYMLESKLGILAGVRAGYDVMAGGLLPQPASGGNSVSLSQAFGNAVSFGLQAGLRFQRRLYLGVIYDHAWGGAGSSSTALANYYTANGFTSPSNGSSSTQVSSNGNMIGIDGGYISNPDGLGIVLDIALAYRAIGMSASNGTFSASYNGAELIVGGGVWIKAGQYIRIVPRIDIALGTFGSQSIKCNGDPGNCTGGDPGTSVSSAPIHAVVFLGLGGYFNLDFGRRP
jgi:hypothetical protein